jgi:hypothetical protein
MKVLVTLLFSIVSIGLFAQHTVVLSSGQKVEGVVLSIEHDVLTLAKDGSEEKYQLKNVSSIFFKEYVPYDGAFIKEGKEKTLQADGFTVKYQIKDREIVRPPKVSIGTEDKGAVVVKVTVDRYGNIRSAEPGMPGSTTSNQYLYTKAKTAAQSAQFDENLKGPLMTEGTITIIY